jgi:hypothetical protein
MVPLHTEQAAMAAQLGVLSVGAAASDTLCIAVVIAFMHGLRLHSTMCHGVMNIVPAKRRRCDFFSAHFLDCSATSLASRSQAATATSSHLPKRAMV